MTLFRSDAEEQMTMANASVEATTPKTSMAESVTLYDGAFPPRGGVASSRLA